ncbi:DNRLRE domain-containing protein [Streptomyces griseoluteus]|uniref:DNRLRE domain-containing protein n=1 Tax=Streptomyces griseoluteus TaxID=29306 RepID=UPI0036A654CF
MPSGAHPIRDPKDRGRRQGSYDSGTTKASSFLQFSSLGSTIAGRQVSAATLNVRALWSATCTPEAFSVYPVTQSWSPSTTTIYPGPSYGSAIGSLTPDPGASCSNSTGSTRVGVKMPVPPSTSWFTRVAAGGIDYGLALAAPTGDGLHWKKFHSDDSATSGWRPSLDLTYGTNVEPQVNASYPPENFQPELLVYASREFTAGDDVARRKSFSGSRWRMSCRSQSTELRASVTRILCGVVKATSWPWWI